MRIVVCHQGYGCDTGCCGHAFYKVTDDTIVLSESALDQLSRDGFAFDHPEVGEDFRAFAERAIALEYGADHVKDLDFAHCIILADHDW